MIHHHPPLELLLDYASGSLPEPAAMVVAAHATLCAGCRHEIAAAEAVGGALLEDIEPAAIGDAALDAVMSRLEQEEAEGAPGSETAFAADRDAEWARSHPDLAKLLPGPVRAAVAGSGLSWRKVGGMFEQIKLPVRVKGSKASLVRFPPNSTIPAHTHYGCEYTLVLAGGFRDNGSPHLRGDFSLKDAADTHRPVVDAGEPCVCLIVLDGPIRLTGTLGRLLNPLVRKLTGLL